MDEMWQRHKAFILKCVIGGIVFLIAWGVKSNMYSETEQIQGANERKKRELESQVSDGKAPSKAFIREQEQLAEAGEAQIRDLANLVASTASPKDQKIAYVRENVSLLLGTIGKQAETDTYVGLYQQVAQGCLFKLREAARSELVGRAAQSGKQVDESLGVTQAFQDDQVPLGIHGLSIVTDVVSRCLASEVGDGIDGISDIRISPRGRSRRRAQDDTQSVQSFTVRMTIEGDPDDVMAVLRSFNNTSNPANRLMVLDEITSLTRDNPEKDPVKASISLLGLHHIGVATGGE